jgi:hypothetical protein
VQKLVLNPEELSVQSFETSAGQPARGTVLARATADVAASCQPTFCDDCNATDPNADCASDASADCPSVNLANCQSAYQTECCRPSVDVWGFISGCS